MRRNWRALITVASAVAALVIPARLALGAQDQPRAGAELPRHTLATANYNFLIGSGLLCDWDHSTACPAVARGGNGDSIEITGAGTLNLAGQSVTAAGAFTEKASTGEIMATGVWMATGLMSFQSYGLAPGALQLDYPKLKAYGPSLVGFGKTAGPLGAMMAGPIAAGGLAIIRIRLLPDTGSPRDAVLQINCAKGKVPEEEQTDGVRLTITGGRSFDEEVSGRTVFLLQRPGPSPAWNSPMPAGPER